MEALHVRIVQVDGGDSEEGGAGEEEAERQFPFQAMNPSIVNG